MKFLRAKLATPLLLALAVAYGMPARATEYDDVDRLTQAGKLDEAMTRADRFLAANPRDPQMRFLKGVIQIDAGKNNDAIATFTRLTQDEPELPEPYNNLAVIYAGQGQYDKARAVLESAIKTNPSYSTAHENLGDVYARMASQAYSKALQLDQSNPAVGPKLAVIRQLVVPTSTTAAARGPKDRGTVVAAASPAAAPPPPSPAPAPVPARPAPPPPPPPAPPATPPAPPPAPAPAPAARPAPAPAPAARPAPATPPVVSALPASPATPPRPAEPTRPANAPTAPVTPVTPVTPVAPPAAVAQKPAAAPAAVAQKPAAATGSAEVESAVRAWAGAWAAQDMDGYLRAYGSDFKPAGGQSRKAWEDERRARIVGKSNINVSVQNLVVSIDGDVATARFRQSYRADSLNVNSRKTLELVRHQGQWRIRKEAVGG